ncbi:Holliday junction branch migration protein RuvA [Weissella halotolerans]|nr:Holliday junction branch migration protein RuvA [Weissella halotolerans]
MYEYIKGLVTNIMPTYITVEAAGIGYHILVANPYDFEQSDQPIQVYLEQVIRENEHTLYGFTDLDSKRLFEKLLAVSGIGPKSALAILASNDHTGLVRAISEQDIAFLTKFPGIGKKTAQQIILDLQNKLTDLPFYGQTDLNDLPAAMEAQAKGIPNQALADALLALEALGYTKKQLQGIEKKLATQALTDTAAYVSAGLKLLQ